MPLGLPSFREGAAGRRRGLPHAARHPEVARVLDQRRRRGRLRPEPDVQRAAARAHPRGHREGRLQARPRHLHRASIRPRASSGTTRPRAPRRGTRRPRRRAGTCSRSPATRRARRPSMVELYAVVGREVPDRVDRGRPGRGRLERLEGADRHARRPRADCRRRPVRDQPGDPEAGHRARHREFDPDQAQPDRHGVRDARRHRDGARGRLHRGHLAPFGRDRGLDDCRSRGRDRRRADQDRLGLPHRSHRQVQPAAAHRGGARARGAVRRPVGHQRSCRTPR